MIRSFWVLIVLAAGSHSVLADPSLECSVGSGSQVETGNCLAEVEKTATAAMEMMLGFARSSAEELDQITERSVAVPALEASQQAWATFRDTQCDYAGTLFGGGSGTGIAIQSCRIELIRDRTGALQNMLN